MSPMGPSRRLTTQDSLFAYFERDTAPMSIGTVGIFEGQIPYERLAEHFNSRMPLVPRYRHRLVPAPFGLAHPAWEPDPEFNIYHHVRRLRLPAPGSEEQLAELAGKLYSSPLSRSKPLWEVYLVEGLSQDRSALVGKIHHCLVDGVAGVELMSVSLDISPEHSPPPVSDEEWNPGPIPSRGARLIGAAFDRLGQFARTAGDVQAGLLDPKKPLRRAQHVLLGVEHMGPLFARFVPRTPFNRRLSRQRIVDWLEMPFAEVRAIRSALGGTVNDVALTIVAGAMKRYLEAHGQSTEGVELRIMAPVNIRPDEEKMALGNRISAMFPELPLGIEDPIERLRAVRDRMEWLKKDGQPTGVDAVFQLLDLIPPAVLRLVGGMPQIPNPVLNMVCTNVPGPMIPFYVVGHRLLAHYPLVPLAWDLGVAVCITSYDHKLFISLTADANVVQDLPALKQFFAESFKELRTAAGVVPTDLPMLVGRASQESASLEAAAKGAAIEAAY
jgi:diacylglycerol O-acyltransferase